MYVVFQWSLIVTLLSLYGIPVRRELCSFQSTNLRLARRSSLGFEPRGRSTIPSHSEGLRRERFRLLRIPVSRNLTPHGCTYTHFLYTLMFTSYKITSLHHSDLNCLQCTELLYVDAGIAINIHGVVILVSNYKTTLYLIRNLLRYLIILGLLTPLPQLDCAVSLL